MDEDSGVAASDSLCTSDARIISIHAWQDGDEKNEAILRIRTMTKSKVAVIMMILAVSVLSYSALAGNMNNGAGKHVNTSRTWTLEDIATAPAIEGLTLSENGGWGFYILRESDLGLNRRISSLHRVHLSSGKDQKIVQGDWIESFQAIPNTSAWSVLADLGDGIQLYRIDNQLRVTPILVNPATVTIGATEGAIGPPPATEAPRHFGVLSYRWSPDGRMLWYTRAKLITREIDEPLINDAVWWAGAEKRWKAPALIEFRVRVENGDEILIDQRSTKDSIALYRGGNANWSSDSTQVTYTVENYESSELKSYVSFTWDRDTRTSKRAIDPPANPYDWGAIGPLGGRLQTDSFGPHRKLEELLPDGSKHTYHGVDFRIGDIRGSGSWLSSDGARSVFGTRHIDSHPRYGLAILERGSNLRLIETAGSLTKCDFNDAVDAGVCVREGMAMSPDLVRVDPGSGLVVPVVSLAPRHAAIAPLRVEHRTWINRDGYSATGFVVYPRKYVSGHRYPALVVTHGGDADERFASPDFQWDYPVQVFAERGYVVLCINDPSSSQNKEIRTAYDEWVTNTGTMPSSSLQKLLWFTGVHSLEDAIKELSAEGLVDISRVGIAGFSRGAQMVDVTMTQSTIFKAASSGDGGYLAPTAFYSPYVQLTYKAVFGGSPYDPATQDNYRRLSPTFRAAQAAGPILQQVATAHQAFIEFYQELRSAGVPAQVTLYRGEDPMSDETHLFHIPSNRLAAMEENLDWFDFWLRNIEDSVPAKAGQYQRWGKMRESRCRSLRGTNLPPYCRSQEQPN